MELRIYKKKWRLKKPFSASYGVVSGGENLYVEITDGKFSGWGEAAPKPTKRKGLGVRYSHSYDHIFKDLRAIASAKFFTKVSMEKLQAFHRKFNFLSPEARCAIDLAICDYLAKCQNIPSVKLFGCKIFSRPKTKLSFSIGATDKDELRRQTRLAVSRCDVIKYKTSEENISRLPWKMLRKKSVILDFDGVYNNFDLFKKEILDQIPAHQEVILEEPMHFVGSNKNHIKKIFDFIEKRGKAKVVFDDSVDNVESARKVLFAFPNAGVNIKLQKMGGLFPCVKLLKHLSNKHLIMIGCLYETSLSISAAAQLKYLRAESIDDLDADIYTGLDGGSPSVEKIGRFVRKKIGLGYNPVAKNLKFVGQFELS